MYDNAAKPKGAARVMNAAHWRYRRNSAVCMGSDRIGATFLFLFLCDVSPLVIVVWPFWVG